MNSSMVVKIAIVATVTVGGMDAAVEPIRTYSWRVTGKTMAILPVFQQFISSALAPFFGDKKGALCFYCLRFLLRHA
ncbi:hypothetical protein [Shewanella sp. 8A]|uniref:hypothetical protein n=1 Tax=Shewanella sp. 8A TaxID=2943323 RepID=UPI00201A4662|nr:hypothetical protein [Shewanella sp. 8A]